jgi:hypothetical protein
MNRWIYAMVAASLLPITHCGKEMDPEDSEMLRRRADGMRRIAEIAREFRQEVRSQNKEEQPEPCLLEKVLPVPLPGWRTTTKHRDPSDPAPLSGQYRPRVSRIYKRGKEEVSIEIIDTLRLPVSLPDWAIEQERPPKGKHPGADLWDDREWPRFEEFKPHEEEGTLEVLFGRRYLLRLHGRGIADLSALRTYLLHATPDLLPNDQEID